MGGHQGGEIASRMAVETFISYLRENLNLLLMEETLREAIHSGFFLANKGLRQLEAQHVEMDGLGTTLTVAVLVGDRYLIGHIGDTRAYGIVPEGYRGADPGPFRQRRIGPQGTDVRKRCRPQPLFACPGQVPGFARKTSPLTSCPSTDIFVAREGTALLLCCDGVFQSVSDFDIYEQVLHTPDIRRAAGNLVALAFANGSKDNFSILLVEFGKMRRAKPLLTPLRSPFKKSRKTIWIVSRVCHCGVPAL